MTKLPSLNKAFTQRFICHGAFSVNNITHLTLACSTICGDGEAFWTGAVVSSYGIMTGMGTRISHNTFIFIWKKEILEKFSQTLQDLKRNYTKITFIGGMWYRSQVKTNLAIEQLHRNSSAMHAPSFPSPFCSHGKEHLPCSLCHSEHPFTELPDHINKSHERQSLLVWPCSAKAKGRCGQQNYTRWPRAVILGVL